MLFSFTLTSICPCFRVYPNAHFKMLLLHRRHLLFFGLLFGRFSRNNLTLLLRLRVSALGYKIISKPSYAFRFSLKSFLHIFAGQTRYLLIKFAPIQLIVCAQTTLFFVETIYLLYSLSFIGLSSFVFNLYEPKFLKFWHFSFPGRHFTGKSHIHGTCFAVLVCSAFCFHAVSYRHLRMLTISCHSNAKAANSNIVVVASFVDRCFLLAFDRRIVVCKCCVLLFVLLCGCYSWCVVLRLRLRLRRCCRCCCSLRRKTNHRIE